MDNKMESLYESHMSEFEYENLVKKKIRRAKTLGEAMSIVAMNNLFETNTNHFQQYRYLLNLDNIQENYNTRQAEEELAGLLESITNKKVKNYNTYVKLLSDIESTLTTLKEHNAELDEEEEEINSILDTIYESMEIILERSKREKLEDKIDKKVDSFIKKRIKKKKDEDVNDVIKGALPKASTIFKYALGLGVSWAINPVLAITVAITKLALNKKAKKKAKARVLDELEDELEMVEEKLKDAESEGKKKEKYELMRAKQKIEKNIEKVKYNIKNYD